MLYRRISADCHIDLPWLPPDLFVSEASPSLRHLMPRVVDGEDGSRWVTGDGRHLGLVNGVGPRGNPHIPGRNARVDRMAATGLYEDAKNGIRRCTEPDLRIKDLSDDGIDAEVIYGILGAAARIDNHTAVNEMVRIYNDWLNEFCSRHPERHIGLASLPYQDVDAAVAEVYRVAKCGFRGVELACAWDMAPLCDPSWEPLWQALNEMDLPLHFHTAFRTPWDYPERFTGQTRRAVLFMLEAGFQMATVNILGAMMGAALF